MGFRRRLEYCTWSLGIALLTLYGSARLWAEKERRAGLEALRAGAASIEGGSTSSDAWAQPSPSDATVLLTPADAPVQRGSSNAMARPSAADAPVTVQLPTLPAAPSATGLDAAIDQSLWSEERSEAFIAAAAQPGAPVAALLIPSIRLEVPIYSGTSELNLNRGAAHIEGTSPAGAAGNVGIAAHRDGFFRGLESLNIDADIYLEVGSQTVRYRVVDIRIVKPTEVHVLAPTETPSVTLVTCYPFYFVGNAPERYIIRGELVEPDESLPPPIASRQPDNRKQGVEL